MLYCHSDCGAKWLDNENGCQQSDADAYCKLKLCREDAFAVSFKIKKLQGAIANQPAFACQDKATNKGNWLGMTKVNFGWDLKNHGSGGQVITDVSCKTMGTFGNVLI